MPHAEPDRQFDAYLADISFKSVMGDVVKRRDKDPFLPPSLTHNNGFAEGGYHICTALHNLMDNTYYLSMPFDVDLELNEQGTIIPFFRSGWFRERGTTMAGAFNVDFLYEVSLFAEEPVEISVTPPYVHQTSLPKYGFLASVKWDISSWFRPCVFLFQLWPGVRELRLKAGEPFAYIHFHTDRPIIFKQVQVNKTMLSISWACLNHKRVFPFEKLSKLYERFRQRGLRDALLKELRNNVIK